MDCCESGRAAPSDYLPRGKPQQIGLLNTYTSEPPSVPIGVLVLLPDGFGLALHNYILADMFAAKGWHVIIPDYFEGDPIPLVYLKRTNDPSIEDTGLTQDEVIQLRDFNIMAWAERHPHEHVETLLRSFFTDVCQAVCVPKKRLFGVGYCFGGKHVLRLASSTFVASAAFHPSSVMASDTTGHKSPLFIGCGEKDDMVSPTLPEDLRTALEGSGSDFIVKVYPGMRHGFAARPNHGDEEVKKQFNRAFEDAVDFLEKSASLR